MIGLLVAILLGIVVYLASGHVIYGLVAFLIGLLLVGGYGWYGDRRGPPV